MILESGTIPYEYVVQSPFLGSTHSPGVPCGPSGILVEQAAWVLMAEIRRYNGSGLFNTGLLANKPVFNNHPNRFTPDDQLYEPTTDGQTFNNPSVPLSLINTTNVKGVRDLMLLMFFGSFGTGGIGGGASEDWFLETFPNHERGTSASAFFAQDIFTHPMSANGTLALGELGQDPQAAEDFVFSGKEYFPFGSSGVLYDIDFGELMYQPWPRLVNSFSSAGTIFGGVSAPVSPQFQKPNGAFIAVSNGGSAPFQGAGQIAARGDVLMSNTEIVITDTNDFDPSNVDGTMSFAQPGLADLPGTIGVASTIAEAGYNTVGLSVGTYRLASRFTQPRPAHSVLSSGIRSSVWPGITQSTDGGYHVFNDAIFIEAPQGAAVVSPLNGDIKHTCLRENTISTPQWQELIGVARPSTDTLIKMGERATQISFDPNTGIQELAIGFAEFDDVVNRVSTSSGTYSLPTVDPAAGGSPPFTNPDFPIPDGFIDLEDCFSFTGNDGTGTGPIYVIEQSSERIHAFSAGLAYNHTIHTNDFRYPRGAEFNGDIWTFGVDDRFYNATDGITGGSFKTLDVATNFPLIVTTDITIHGAWEVTGGTDEADGFYVLWSARASAGTSFPRAHRVSRVTEQLTTFRVEENIISASAGTSTSLRDNIHIWHRTI